jgi:hypothetical protein
MTYLTWDTLSIPDDPQSIQDQQDAWEKSIDKDQVEKIRIPIKAMDPEIKSIEVQIKEPEIKNPEQKTKGPEVTIIKTGKKKNKGGLF